MEEGILSDHSPLLVRLSLSNLNLLIPQARPPPSMAPTQVVVRPISDSDQATFRQAIQMYSTGQAGQIHALHHELKEILDTTITPYLNSISTDTGKTSNRLASLLGVNPALIIEDLSTKLLSISSESHKIMLETCTTKTTNPSGTHYRKRCVNKQRKRLTRCLQQLKQVHREVRQGEVDTIAEVTQILEAPTEKINMPTETYLRWTKALAMRHERDEHANRASPILQSMQADLRKEIKTLDKEHSRTTFQRAVTHTRHMINTKPKQANRQMRQAAKVGHTNE